MHGPTSCHKGLIEGILKTGNVSCKSNSLGPQNGCSIGQSCKWDFENVIREDGSHRSLAELRV